MSTSNYIDMHTSVLGYASRIREVSVRKGSPFMAVNIRGMHGEKGAQDGITYVPFDVKATTVETDQLLRQMMADANDPNLRMMVQVKIGDFYPECFTQTKGDRAGELVTVLRGRLLQINRVWIKPAKGDEQQGWKLAYEHPRVAKSSDDSQDDSAAGSSSGEPEAERLAA